MAREIEEYIERAKDAGYQTGANILGAVVEGLRARRELPDELPPARPIHPTEDKQLELFQLATAPIDYRYDEREAHRFVRIVEEFRAYERGEEILYTENRRPTVLTPRFANSVRHQLGGNIEDDVEIGIALQQIRETLMDQLEANAIINFGRIFKQDQTQRLPARTDAPKMRTVGDVRRASLSDLADIDRMGPRSAVFLTAALAPLLPIGPQSV